MFSSVSSNELKLAMVQLGVGATKKVNLSRAASKVQKAATQGAKLISLPEFFNAPYGIDYFKEYAEEIPGESSDCLSQMAKENKVYLIGGSIPEKDGQKIYNTCTVWDPEGKMVAKHRKVHLFDIDIPGGITFKESLVLSPGNNVTTFDLPECKVGLGICYDLRFAELAQIYTQMGCHLIVYPGAFNMTTGPAHWQLLQQARALDNQVFIATASPARDENASYIAWGHSSVVNPWGEVIANADEKEDIVYANLDFEYMEKVRNMVPLQIQRRTDIYEVIKK